MEIVLLGVIAALAFGLVSTTPDILQEFCDSETFKAECEAGEVIEMQIARFGRMRMGTCLKVNYGHQGCSEDALPVFDGHCSGRQSCDIHVRDLVAMGVKPCTDDLRSYLEARYTCIKVTSPSDSACRASRPVVVTEPEGYISNSVTENTNCGGIDSPWVLRAQPGQRINITLLDYGALLSRAATQGIRVCQVLAVVKEKTRGASETVCGSNRRQELIYVSTSNEVEIRIVLKSNKEEKKQERYFLLHYQAYGCPDVPVAKNTWFRRTPEGASIGCVDTTDEWHLTCKDDEWVGAQSNCTGGADGPRTGSVVMKSILSLPYGLSVAIMVAIALVIGALVLVIGLVLIKRRRHQARPPLPVPVQSKGASKDGYYTTQSRHYNSHHQVTAGISNDALYSSSAGTDTTNNYYRTWDLQHHPSNQSSTGHLTSGTMTGYPSAHAQDASPPRYMEHIYESPKSVRRQLEGDSLQYYELDPHAVDPPGTHGTIRTHTT